jgi:hypothetical protein
MAKTTIRNYDHFKKLRRDKVIKKKHTVAQVVKKFDIGTLQLLAWAARYEVEKKALKAAKHN